MPDALLVTETQILTEQVEDITILSVAEQGPPGTPGPAGVQGTAGPQGPPGERGPAGDLSYLHTQSNAASVWTINHGLGKYPSVTVVDSAGDECEGSVNYTSTSQVVITFSAAFSGRAFLN